MEQFNMEDLLKRIENKLDMEEKERSERYRNEPAYTEESDELNIDEMIRNIDKKIEELESKNSMPIFNEDPFHFDVEKEIEKIDSHLENLVKENKLDKDAKVSVSVSNNDFVTPIKETVARLSKVGDIEKYKDRNKYEYDKETMILINNYNAILRMMNEAKRHIRNFANFEGNASKEFWLDFIGESEVEVKQSTTKSNKELELNVNESDTLKVNNDLRIIINHGEVENLSLINNLDNLDNIEVHYEINYKGTNYRAKLYFENNNARTKLDDNCPYQVFITSWYKNKDDDMMVTFKIFEK